MSRAALKFRVWDAQKRTLEPLTHLDQLSDPALVVTQFTGIYDRRGQEIWEGDITRWRYDFSLGPCAGVSHYLVRHYRGCFGSRRDGNNSDDFTPYTEINSDEEVVGNRFFDLDLLALDVEY